MDSQPDWFACLETTPRMLWPKGLLTFLEGGNFGDRINGRLTGDATDEELKEAVSRWFMNIHAQQEMRQFCEDHSGLMAS